VKIRIVKERKQRMEMEIRKEVVMEVRRRWQETECGMAWHGMTWHDRTPYTCMHEREVMIKVRVKMEKEMESKE
jgi:hypothetical protein